MIRIPRYGRWLLGAAILVSASAQTRVDLRTQGKNVDFSGVPTRPFQTGTVLPATCAVGATFFKTDALAGKNFYGCTAPNVWTGGSGGSIVLAGDATGPSGSTVVQALQGRPVSATAPSDGQTLQWNGTSSQWAPAGAAANYSAAFTSQTSIVIPGTAHGYATSNLLVQCYDTGSSIIIPSSVSINNTTYDVTIGFLSAHSGRCLVNGGGSGNSGGGGTSSVVSVFGRNGIVSAQTGDYGFSQITGTVSNAQVATGIDAGKIGPGTVSSSTFGQLANVRSDVQAQIDGKAALVHSHTTSGDVTGDLSALVVTGIRGQPVAATPAADGQVLTWSAASAQWGPSSVSGGGGGGALSTLGVALTSPTVLTIGAGCSAAAPCNIRFGSTVWSIQRPATATITSGTGTAFIWVDQTGAVTVGHNLSLTCSTGCQAQSGIISFPTNVIPIATWTATSGTWAAQGSDWRAWLSTKVLNAGQGIMVIDAGGTSTVAVDATIVPTYLKGSATLDFPAIPNGACAADQAISVPGATLGDAVAPGWPALLPGLLGTMSVSATDTVSVRLCNLSGMIADPAIATFSATIIRSF